jgi:hypothetical protein
MTIAQCFSFGLTSRYGSKVPKGRLNDSTSCARKCETPHYPTTIFTSFFGTTITFLIAFPSTKAFTFSADFAAVSKSP